MFGELLAITLILYALYKWVTLYHDYFEQRNLKYLNPKFFGSTIGIFFNKYSAVEFAQRIYNAFPNES